MALFELRGKLPKHAWYSLLHGERETHDARLVWGCSRLTRAAYSWHAWTLMLVFIERAYTTMYIFPRSQVICSRAYLPKKSFTHYFSFLPPNFHRHQTQPSDPCVVCCHTHWRGLRQVPTRSLRHAQNFNVFSCRAFFVRGASTRSY